MKKAFLFVPFIIVSLSSCAVIDMFTGGGDKELSEEETTTILLDIQEKNEELEAPFRFEFEEKQSRYTKDGKLEKWRDKYIYSENKNDDYYYYWEEEVDDKIESKGFAVNKTDNKYEEVLSYEETYLEDGVSKTEIKTAVQKDNPLYYVQKSEYESYLNFSFILEYYLDFDSIIEGCSVESIKDFVKEYTDSGYNVTFSFSGNVKKGNLTIKTITSYKDETNNDTSNSLKYAEESVIFKNHRFVSLTSNNKRFDGTYDDISETITYSNFSYNLPEKWEDNIVMPEMSSNYPLQEVTAFLQTYNVTTSIPDLSLEGAHYLFEPYEQWPSTCSVRIYTPNIDEGWEELCNRFDENIYYKTVGSERQVEINLLGMTTYVWETCGYIFHSYDNQVEISVTKDSDYININYETESFIVGRLEEPAPEEDYYDFE